jgi:hypothetical protein
MIVRPTADLGVELIDQIGGRHVTCVVDDSSDGFQEGSNIPLGRLDEQFPVRVSAHALSEEIKAVLHVTILTAIFNTWLLLPPRRFSGSTRTILCLVCGYLINNPRVTRACGRSGGLRRAVSFTRQILPKTFRVLR